MRIPFILGALLVLVSCSKQTSGDKNTNDTLQNDSSAISMEMEDSAAIPIHSYLLNDSSWKTTSLRVLDKKEIKSLLPSNEAGNSSIDNLVRRYFELDSIQRKLKPSDFDLGSIVKVSVKFMDTLSANTEYTLCSWIIEYSSYEACPYFSGTKCIISTFNNSTKKIISSAVIAEIVTSGDPPAWGSNSLSTRVFSDGKLSLEFIEQYGEDEDGVETKQTQAGEIKSDGTITLQDKKEVSKTKIKQS
jgi:hypothetical protein